MQLIQKDFKWRKLGITDQTIKELLTAVWYSRFLFFLAEPTPRREMIEDCVEPWLNNKFDTC